MMEAKDIWSMDELQALCHQWELQQNEGDDTTGDGFLSWLCWEVGIYSWERVNRPTPALLKGPADPRLKGTP